MITRQYGKTGETVSAIGFGGMRFRAIDDKDVCLEAMVEAARSGITYFDTAPGYFDGKSELRFGEGFAELRRRGLPFTCSSKTSLSKEGEIRAELDGQLRRLGLDAIDFYHIWCVTSLSNWGERKKNGVVRTFRKLKEEGLIRHICISSHLIGDEIRELLDEGIFEGVLFGYSAYNFNTRKAAFDAIRRQSLGTVVMNPLGGGIIPQNPRLFEFIRTQAEETVVEAAIRFLLAHRDISVILVGMRDAADVREAVRAAEGYRPLSPEELERIASSAGGSFQGLCTGCQYCDDCPQGIPIPKLMDAYNQKILYGQDQQLLNRLAWHWNVGPEIAATCAECGQCEKACTQHLQIMDRLKEIAGMSRAGRP